jgi:hypothetical protein
MATKGPTKISPGHHAQSPADRAVNIKLENCYGIKRFQENIAFRSNRPVVIYAPNGAMKTSFSKTFMDFINDQPSVDRIYKERVAIREIRDSNNIDLSKEQVFVIESYNPNFKSKKVSTLLANKTLKDQYDKIYSEIEEKKEALLKELKGASGLKSGVEETLSLSIAHTERDFFKSVERVEKEVLEGKEDWLCDIKYQTVFNDKVVALLETPDFKVQLAKYMKEYDELITKSRFFRKGVFNHNNAVDIAKSLKDNGFFEAKHTVTMVAKAGKEEIKTEQELIKVIEKEKDSILTDPKLIKAFNEIDKKLDKNKETKEFRNYLDANKGVLVELNNLALFKEKLWIAYLIKSKAEFKSLMETYTRAKGEIEKILKAAKKEETKWKSVINIFNERFSVPFLVTIDNQEDVILRSEAPSVGFNFVDPTESAMPVEERDLWGVLSNGETRALYLLNIIFEIEGRREQEVPTLFIIDDIADSFDYKNKYAIIEYLSDIAREPLFHQIILTHNFDFFRTISSRLNIPRENKFHTSKGTTAVKLVEEKYQKNPFTTWKDHLDIDEMLIASIPFVRNLAEFCGFDAHFKTLTSLLHCKADTDAITVGALQAILKDILKDKPGLVLTNTDKPVKKLIYEVSERILGESSDVVELEKKIVLSIAIRLKTEEFLIREINDQSFISGITRNQTIELISRFKEIHPGKKTEIALAEQVNLMTPENIHINSFMYEPILDMANEHLKRLYRSVRGL